MVARTQSRATPSASSKFDMPSYVVEAHVLCVFSAIIEASMKRKSKGVVAKKGGASKKSDSQLQVDMDE